jgi:tRNA (guanine37-N1)-methyltransferase
MSNLLRVKILTLFPDLFPGPLGHSITGRALKQGIWTLEAINIRDFARDRYHTVDGPAIGGGIGMILKPDVLADAIEYAKADEDDYNIFYMSPRGQKLNQKLAEEVSGKKKMIIICGRFEGIDQRIIDHYQITEISIGDYVLTGGEIAAHVLLDSCVRLLPGVLSDSSVFTEESFGNDPVYNHLLEYPQYTKPLSWQGRNVPDILLTGHHENIKKWKLQQAEAYTRKYRPDLWALYQKTNKLG